MADVSLLSILLRKVTVFNHFSFVRAARSRMQRTNKSPSLNPGSNTSANPAGRIIANAIRRSRSISRLEAPTTGCLSLGGVRRKHLPAPSARTLRLVIFRSRIPQTHDTRGRLSRLPAAKSLAEVGRFSSGGESLPVANGRTVERKVLEGVNIAATCACTDVCRMVGFCKFSVCYWYTIVTTVIIG